MTLLIFNFCSCKKDSIETPVSTSSLISTPSQYNVIFDGQSFSAKENLGGYTNLSFSDDNSTANFTYYSFINSDSAHSSLSLKKGSILHYSGPPTSAQLTSFFSPGSYNYNTNYSDTDVVLLFSRNNTDIWQTNYPPFDQSGSTFQITDAVNGTDIPLQVFYVKINIHFSCKVYNNAGDQKTISGTAVFKFLNI